MVPRTALASGDKETRREVAVVTSRPSRILSPGAAGTSLLLPADVFPTIPPVLRQFLAIPFPRKVASRVSVSDELTRSEDFWEFGSARLFVFDRHETSTWLNIYFQLESSKFELEIDQVHILLS